MHCIHLHIKFITLKLVIISIAGKRLIELPLASVIRHRYHFNIRVNMNIFLNLGIIIFL